LTAGALDGGHERVVAEILSRHAVTRHAEAKRMGSLTAGVVVHVLIAGLIVHVIAAIGSRRLAAALVPVSHIVPLGDAYSR